LSWVPIVVLPNVNVKARVEGKHAAIVGYYDKRLTKLRGQHPTFKGFLSRFRDAFGEIQRPSVLLLNEEGIGPFANAEAIAAFRDLAAASVVPYNRAWVLKHGRSNLDPAFSNSFAFYPWMMDKHFDGLVASTPAMLASHDTEKFRGYSSPEISYGTVSDLDDPLLQVLIERWEARFSTASPTWADRALFRSLNMAFQASQTPFNTAGTTYDSGRLVALWVSAFEILAHPGHGGNANKEKVLKVLLRSNPASAAARKTVYKRLNRVRNDYIHGNPIADPSAAMRLSNYGGVLYRLMLTEFLELHRKIPKIARRKGWEKRMGIEIAKQIEFNGHQARYEDALDTYLNPQPRRGMNHRRPRRTPPAEEGVVSDG
jgi:hypothetical protein